ncbi:hypothetical protein RHGRI_020577 [Rhododendron griersonianum]|uniref:Uncharacterized protein n=1 Tax=Rhododendron griersonianum TaxID=479676 RepID=A0AAV6JL59_9ERIC|nr:hypothetical protein RHGRI_020577 [Rhododendron griersonianum]
MYFGNVGLYYLSEKSVASILTFLFLAFYCICTLFCIQPYTDFGTIEFLLSASLNQTLSLLGLRSSYSWLVIIACIVIAGIRYHLEPVYPPGLEATSDEGQHDSGELLPITSKKEDPLPPRLARIMLVTALPGIEDFQIIGEAKLGNRLLGCGIPVRGTSLCLFQVTNLISQESKNYQIPSL